MKTGWHRTNDGYWLYRRDIVDRLRSKWGASTIMRRLMHEAADEIERLRRESDRWCDVAAKRGRHIIESTADRENEA